MLELDLQLSRNQIPANADAQLVYALVTLFPSFESQAIPLNLNFVVDVDCLTQQSDGFNLLVFLSEFVSSLPQGSGFSLSLINDKAQVVLASASAQENLALISNQLATNLQNACAQAYSDKISLETLQDAIKIAQVESRRFDSKALSRLVLISKRQIDDQNLELRQQLLKSLALQAKKSQVSPIDIYCTGVSCNTDLLVDLTEKTNARFRFVADMSRFLQTFLVSTLALTRSCVSSATLAVKPVKDVEVRRCYAIGASLNEIDLSLDCNADTVTINLNSITNFQAFLGNIRPKEAYTLLLELQVPTRPAGRVCLGLLDAEAFYDGQKHQAQSKIIIQYGKEDPLLMQHLAVTRAVDICSALRIFEQGQAIILKGEDKTRGLKILANAASIMDRSGEFDFAAALRGILANLNPESFELKSEMIEKLFKLRSDLRSFGLKGQLA